jgi:structure-specific recognition protein 1
LKEFIKANFSIDTTTEEISTKGWNWGETLVDGPVLSFIVGDQKAFELPLAEVSKTSTPTKNEVMLDFHQDDTNAEGAESLIEMRFFIPNTKPATEKKEGQAGAEEEEEEEAEEEGDDRTAAEKFHEMLSSKADLVPTTGKGVVVFNELPVLTPRGRYTVDMFPSFLKMHGKTYDYKVKYSSVVRLFQLPKPDGRSCFFVVSLEPPIRQGHTSYPHLVMQLSVSEEIEVDVNQPEEKDDPRFVALGTKQSGSVADVVASVFKSLTQKKVTIPRGFTSSSVHSAVRCTLKANEGFLYPLDRSFFFVHKPPTHIRFEEITTVEFARVSDGSQTNRTFDLIVNTRSGQSFNFTSIPRSDYPPLFQFISSKDLKMLNVDENVARAAAAMNRPAEVEPAEDSMDIDSKPARKREEAEEPAGDSIASRRSKRSTALAVATRIKQDLLVNAGDESSEDDDFNEAKAQADEEAEHDDEEDDELSGEPESDDDAPKKDKKRAKPDDGDENASDDGESKPKKKKSADDDEDDDAE